MIVSNICFRTALIYSLFPADERRGYEEKYEDDALGEELGEGARVWYMFLEEGSEHDTRAFQGLRDHLDVDLVFVSSTFR